MAYNKRNKNDGPRVPSAQEVTKIERNWEIFVKLINSITNEDAKSALIELSSEVKDRMAAAPASTRTEYVGAYSGGLVQHSLNVAKHMAEMNKTVEGGVSRDSIIITGLFHDIGKIGNLKEDYYIDQESKWHRERGMIYELNKNLLSVPVCQRSLWWLNGAGCPLSEDEIGAISSMANVGQTAFSSHFYNASMLTVLLQTGVRVACIQGTGKETVLG